MYSRHWQGTKGTALKLGVRGAHNSYEMCEMCAVPGRRALRRECLQWHCADRGRTQRVERKVERRERWEGEKGGKEREVGRRERWEGGAEVRTEDRR
jgi:hypothetical protein